LASDDLYDLVVIGGGINGAGIARDAAGRGLRVLLCEQADLAQATSSASTKLIHGGLRYLEHREFRLVREALTEREVLLRAAPHIIWPLSFVLPHDSSLRPAWMIRLGLFLYDHLGGRELLPGSRRHDLRRSPLGNALRRDLQTGFSYADCWVQDARLVVLNAIDARERGARIMTRTRCTGARRRDGCWEVTLEAAEGGQGVTVRSRALVNAAGPWVTDMLDRIGGVQRRSALRLVKGSHIVVRRAYEGDHAYIFQNDDRRIVFAIPYEGEFTLIGTTDVDYRDDPAKVAIDEAERDYLLRAVNRYLRAPLSADDVVWTYSGVRPLYDDATANASAVTRDYVFDMDGAAGEPPLLSVFGGKITTYRRLAEHALERLSQQLGWAGRPWTAKAPLPGGDIPGADFEGFLASLRREFPWLPETLVRRYARAYGTRSRKLLNGASSVEDLGRDFGAGLHEAELRYLAAEEWARTAEDVLWRRSKLGLHLTAEGIRAVDDWFRRRADDAPPPAARNTPSASRRSRAAADI